MLVVVPDGIDHRNVLALDWPFRERKIDSLQHARRTGLFVGVRARYAADQRRVNCRRRSLAAHIAHDDSGNALPTVLQEVVEVAADLTRRRKPRRDFGILEQRQLLWQQAELQLAGQRQVLLQALLLARDAFVQRRILDRDGHLGRHGGHDTDVVFIEVVAPRVLDVEDADHLVFVDQRNA